MNTNTPESFQERATYLAYEICEHLTAKAEILLADESPGMIGATYQITSAYILANVVKILRLAKKTDAHIMKVLVEGLNESFKLATMSTQKENKKKH